MYSWAIALLLLYWSWGRWWLWRLVRRVWHFRTLSDKRIVVHYDPQLEDKWNWSKLMERCHVELDNLRQQFGFSLPRRPVVFLFSSWLDINKVFGRACAGTALPAATAIVVGQDTNLERVMRHELTHLFSARWNQLAPPLLNEGLAVWLEQAGRPIDIAARPLLANRNLKLRFLLKRKFFYSEPYRPSCYVLAGSFTGFLIRRYGWKPYRKLYRRCDGLRFDAKFQRCFGVSFEKAEWQWRNQLIVMEILNRRN
jgi:hypothetical protein